MEADLPWLCQTIDAGKAEAAARLQDVEDVISGVTGCRVGS